ncbi:MAG: glycosyltransferase family 8 protein [Candidatus Symbiothrix sp.]|jgi:lipopolysaccharide biosynthesis glycosyltransferase|nr:glycosyltransferase family 8 protein [Candidatus Symbiothrix sp.]
MIFEERVQQKEVVPVCFSTNNAYVPQMATAIQSIVENSTKDKLLKFYVLFTDISEQYINMLTDQVKVYENASVEFIDVSEYIERVTFCNSKICKELFYRFFIPYLLSDYEKIIYLDCDLVCIDDITKLIAIDLKDNMLGAMRDFFAINEGGWGVEHAKKLGLKIPSDYFNAGVLVFNTKNFGNNISEETLFDYCKTEYGFHDQDILNLVCEGKVHFLEANWNALVDELPGKTQNALLKRYFQFVLDPSIIHYTGDKPWKHFNITKRNIHFWIYASKTPFKDIIYANLKNADIKEEAIYNEIKHGRYGLKFILKCLSLYICRVLRRKK